MGKNRFRKDFKCQSCEFFVYRESDGYMRCMYSGSCLGHYDFNKDPWIRLSALSKRELKRLAKQREKENDNV